MTIQELRSDLRAIKYYYSKQKEFEKAAETVGESKIDQRISYNNLIKIAKNILLFKRRPRPFQPFV